ncbi:MAG: inorganic phosphate transporter [Lewinellaceae bacterium]|nr:inorganic phosphate transporter [Lewinellaceae bacterium]
MDIYFLFVLLLFGLAIADLVVGVSNDAVNFLNSAIGSRVATRRIIMVVASLGIVIGALFAGGMMEVARKGIFNPQFFVFAEVMVIFLAVMFTDVVLLDLFNTFGLPTSTTVSIVFELLGAAVAVAAIKVLNNGEGLGAVAGYINSSSALAIITGIFISVGVAFTVGIVVMYLVRLIFTFNYQRRLHTVGIVWGGISLAVITYFLLFKGLKGASFISGSFINWIQAHIPLLFLGSFAIWATILALVNRFTNFNILRIVVLAGTFALAMAFASNDLVNFIGVSVAGFESYNDWAASGASPDGFLMTSLSKAYPAKTYLLLPAGVIMLLTLWLSKKARSVTETEVNLGRQSEGLERFSSNYFARGVVRFAWDVSARLGKVIPQGVKQRIESNFRPQPYRPKPGEEADPPAFDLVRASVNLTVASSLIAFATSLKLPLSTTYVTFMVAMGSSLADRAWGRDSAVFRVAGVLNVLLGWFMTAFIAFTVSAVFALIMSKFGMIGIGLLVAFSVGFIFNTIRVHRRREADKDKLLQATRRSELIPAREVIFSTANNLADSLEAVSDGFRSAIEGLIKEDINMLRQATIAMDRLGKSNEEFKYTFYSSIRRIKEELSEGSRTYLLAYDMEQDLVQSATFIVDTARQHVADILAPLDEAQSKDMRAISEFLHLYLMDCAQVMRDRSFNRFEELKGRKKELLQQIEHLLSLQAQGIKAEVFSARNSILVFNILLETKDLVTVAARFVKLYQRLERDASAEYLLTITSED